MIGVAVAQVLAVVLVVVVLLAVIVAVGIDEARRTRGEDPRRP